MKRPLTPTLEEHGWELESAEERHAQAPDTFNIPNAAERSTLQSGQRVQLLFLFDVGEDGELVIQCEKMWVTIHAVCDGRYEGTLDSCPATLEAVNPGDAISFGAEHVSCVLVAKTDSRHPKYKDQT